MRLWQRPGESYEHVLLKALGYAMFVAEFPNLEIEPRVGLRYRPDLVARNDARAARAAFAFWGECGLVTMRKVGWLLKHAGVERLALLKLLGKPATLVAELRATVDARYRAGERLLLINFVAEIKELTASRQIARVPQSWYTLTVV